MIPHRSGSLKKTGSLAFKRTMAGLVCRKLACVKLLLRRQTHLLQIVSISRNPIQNPIFELFKVFIRKKNDGKNK